MPQQRARRVDDLKKEVRDFWNEASCGERLLLDASDKSGYLAQMEKLYSLEPYIESFAAFDGARDQDVLEISVELGADHQRFAQAGARLTGIDLTERAVVHTQRRIELFGLRSDLRVADAESLPFADESFDWVYSWGVLHHSPDTAKAINEVWRVLKPGGEGKIMIYQKYSMVGFMLWIRYALLRFKPFTSLAEIYAKYLESPGTKAYSISEARQLFSKFRSVDVRIELTHGDLLESGAGQRHQGLLLAAARLIWPRWFIRSFLSKCGLFMLIRAVK
jgi:ubiquinone/menaquinone biosynthesis C-methylase UbiE